MQLNPYLTFNGKCEAAFKFYERVLGGKIEAMMTYGSSPMADQTPADWRNKIMHTRIGGKRDCANADTGDLLGRAFWHAGGPIRYTVDDQLRAAPLTLGEWRDHR